jgi:hypothetical protein
VTVVFALTVRQPYLSPTHARMLLMSLQDHIMQVLLDNLYVPVHILPSFPLSRRLHIVTKLWSWISITDRQCSYKVFSSIDTV